MDFNALFSLARLTWRLAQNKCSVSICWMNELRSVLKKQPCDNGQRCPPGLYSYLPSSLPSSPCWLLVLDLLHYRPQVAVTVSGITFAVKCLKLEGFFLQALVSFPPKQTFPRNLPADCLSSRKAGKCLMERNGNTQQRFRPMMAFSCRAKCCCKPNWGSLLTGFSTLTLLIFWCG